MTTELETWFRKNGGFLHQNIRIAGHVNETAGVHFQATAPIQPGACIASTPHILALSYLNALVDDKYPVFKQQRHCFKVEAIGFFYLIIQYVDRETTFWKPYLDALPSPSTNFSQPLFFEDPEDVAWLEGTDVWYTVTAKRDIYKTYYRDGIKVLQQAGMDVGPYTWHLFKWATTIFASRAFTSRALHPESGKYWTAYKAAADGRRQAVLLDMSTTPAEDLDFPVLFPMLDAANHSHEAKADWTFDPGRFSISTNDDLDAGSEVFNNYGPKGNGELLTGYGFCIPDNPHDSVMLTLAPPPAALQEDLRKVHPGYFRYTSPSKPQRVQPTNAALDGYGQSWSPEKATFHLHKPDRSVGQATRKIFQHLPEPLLELLVYIIRHERGLPFEFVHQPLAYLTFDEGAGRRYLPHVARMVAYSLGSKLAKLQSVPLPSQPQNDRQKQASIYRGSQIDIMSSILCALRTYTRSLIWEPSNLALPREPCLVRLEPLVPVLTEKGVLDDDFLRGIEANANTSDLEQLRLAGWEEDVWVLLLCYLAVQQQADGQSWFTERLPEYIDISEPSSSATGVEQASALMEIVHTAAAACPGSTWMHEMWSPRYIDGVGGFLMRHESFTVVCPDGDGGEEARLCLYFHSRNE